MNKTLLGLYGLKWNPFAPDIPVEALLRMPQVESFCWRVEHLVREGGFALVSGEPGTGKSVALRILADRLTSLRDVVVGVVTHPQSGVSDFYRELGHLFGVPMSASNRWGSFKALRERWQAHIETTMTRPVVIIDEAQEVQPMVLSELRVMASQDFDSRSMLTVILSGDDRLTESFQRADLLPLGSRIRMRLRMQPATPEELQTYLKHALKEAGAGRLMTPELMGTLSEHAAGSYRTLNNIAGELLAAAAESEASKLDEKLYFEVFTPPSRRQTTQKKMARGARR